jgi:ferredoxin-NADP reductase
VARRDHGFHPLAVRAVIPETADAATIVLDVGPDLVDTFAYEAGQFCTVRVEVEGAPLLRCYSMSSAPGVDEHLAITVKRVPEGKVSNWLLDHVEAGDLLELTPPAGVFHLAPEDREIVAFAAGSGITPVISLLKSALHGSERRARLLYANRDRRSVIFGQAIEALAARFPGRLEVVHHLDVDDGFVDGATIRRLLGAAGTGEAIGAGTGYYLCGPAPFMDLVEATLLAAGIDRARVHLERFTTPDQARPVTPAEAATGSAQVVVTIEVDGRQASTEHRAGTTILQTARQLDLSPPASCESGSCATCMARVVSGSVEMHLNNALTEEELADGWILTCQAVPTSPHVGVVYGYDGA